MDVKTRLLPEKAGIEMTTGFEIARGAEAVLYRFKDVLVKDRIMKDYRLKEIDLKLRKTRTKKEANLMQKIDFAPKVIEVEEYRIKMEFIDGVLLKNVLDELNEHERKKIMVLAGEQIAKMHDMNIIHGDLTTSNIILKDSKTWFIDFGLGFVSVKIEDKAVDLHLLKQALEAKHYMHFEESFKSVLEGYKKSKNYNEVMERLKKVESRGRYKGKNETA